MIWGGHTHTRISIVAAALIVVMIAGAWVYRLDRQGVANLRHCGEIEPGGRRADLVQFL